MKRINFILSLIEPCRRIIDIGSDHAYLSIGALKDKKAQVVVNIEVNEKPMQQGILNLTKFNLLPKTINVQNNGLGGLKSKLPDTQFDYAIISGMGSSTIIDIMKSNELDIDTFILQSNKHEHTLRKWLNRNHYQIVKEHFFEERDIWYPIFVVKHNKKHVHRLGKTNIYLGKIKVIQDYAQYERFLKNKLSYLENLNDNAKKKNAHEIRKINHRIKKIDRLTK